MSFALIAERVRVRSDTLCVVRRVVLGPRLCISHDDFKVGTHASKNPQLITQRLEQVDGTAVNPQWLTVGRKPHLPTVLVNTTEHATAYMVYTTYGIDFSTFEMHIVLLCNADTHARPSKHTAISHALHCVVELLAHVSDPN